MGWKNGFYNFFYGVFLGILFIIWIAAAGIVERLLLVIVTLWVSNLVRNFKKHTIKSLCGILAGIFLGIYVTSCGLFFLKMNVKEEPESYENNSPSETAVLLIFEGEPERYNVPVILENIRKQNPISKAYIIPLKLYTYKRAYEKAGISRYKEYSQIIGKKLSEHLDQGYDVYVAYTSDEPHYSRILNEAIVRNGYKKLIAAPVYLGENSDYLYIIKEIERIVLYHRNMQVKFINPLWDSEKILKGLMQEVKNRSEKFDKNGVGFILADMHITGHMNQSIDLKAKKQERFFMDKFKNLFIENGYDKRKIKVVDFETDDEAILEALMELQQYGVSNIYIISINDIWNFVDESYRIDKFIHKMRGKYQLSLNYIEGWGMNDWIIEELEYRIRLLNVQDWNHSLSK